jgi:phosphoglycerate dehydrogenase-like enzyme
MPSHSDSVAKPLILLLAWTPEGALAQLAAGFPQCDFVDGRESAVADRAWSRATIIYGLPAVDRLPDAGHLRWIQLPSAGVPQDLCPLAQRAGIVVTNLAGLYGPSIAEHALALMTALARRLHIVVRNQQERKWDRSVADWMSDLQGRTLAILGLGSIGRSIARLARAFGMRIVGCRRTDQPTADVDSLYACRELHAMLQEADCLAVAAPMTSQTEGMLGPAEFRALKRGAIYINVSRGGIAQEKALLDALRSGQVAAAGLDVFAVEPLADDHPLWIMPQVIISPHYSGETINLSARPVERFARNLRAWLSQGELEGVVNLEWGY